MPNHAVSDKVFATHPAGFLDKDKYGKEGV